MLTMSLLLFVLSGFLVVKSSCMFCPPSNISGVEWLVIEDKILSKPRCISSAKEIAQRECNFGKWGPAPQCATIQDDTPPKCPPGFREKEEICYTITPKTGFPSACPFDDILPFFSYFDIVIDEVEEPIWIPVQRTGLDFIRWIEKSSFYREEFSHEYSYNGSIQGKNCLVIDKSRNVRAVGCGEDHPGVCAYQSLNSSNNKVCSSLGQCRQSSYSSKTTCFCVTDEPHPYDPEAEYIQFYQNSVKINGENCNIGLQKMSNGSYIWKTSMKEIGYTFWSPDTIFDSSNIYGISTSRGWALTNKPTSCSIIKVEAIEPEITLFLSYDKYSNVFTLRVKNAFWLKTFQNIVSVFCFTDAKRDSLISSIDKMDFVNDDNGSTTYTFAPIEPFPGNYLCEAFKFSDSSVVESGILFILDKYNEFVGLFRTKIPIEVNPLSSQLISFLNKTLLRDFNFVVSDGTFYVPRIMEIEDLHETSRSITVNIHFSSTMELNDSKVVQHFNELYNRTVAESNVTLISFLSTQFCLEKNVNGLHWPTTPVGNSVIPKEFCFKTDGNLVTDYCIGSFMIGANWTNSKFLCTKLDHSEITDSILSDNMESYTDQINNILEIDEKKFNALDVYLFVEKYRKCFNENIYFDLDLFSKSIEKILKIDRIILLESEKITRARDRFLNVVTIAMKNRCTQLIKTDNFVCISLSDSRISGVAVELQNGQRAFTQLGKNWTIERLIQEKENLEFAIWLSPELRQQLNRTIHFGFSIFFTDALFQESTFDYGVIPAIFGVTIQSDVKSLPAPVLILQNTTPEDDLTASCAKWIGENNIPGMWYYMGDPFNISSYVVCPFWETGYVGISMKGNDENVTSDLENLLEMNAVDTYRISKLANISKKHESFQPIDVLLVGKVLKLESDQNYSTNELANLVKVVDNLHKIKKSVLSQSQEQHKATDLILYYVDQIVKNSDIPNAEILLSTDNFILLVSNFREANFTGLLISESGLYLQMQVLRGDLGVSDVLASYPNFSSCILFSSNLKNQLEDDTKVVITYFFNDVLFNGNQSLSKHNHLSKIFGVILPEVGTYSGPISILYNLTDSDKLECGHWSYDQNQSVSYWKTDNDAEKLWSVSQCDFWHTTHFALLLLNNDQYSDYDVLDWVTTINTAISLVSLLAILLTAVLFQKWRQNIGNQILINFSCAIILQIVTFYIASTIQRHTYDKVMCTLIGVLLHYSIISQFCWMLTIAILQFTRFVQVFASSPRYLLLKACVCGWVFPILPVMLALVVDDENYVYSSVGLCYPSGLGLYLGVWVPIAIIGSINGVIFVYIIYSVLFTDIETTRSSRNNGKHHWRLFVLLFFMLGLTWIFGFLSGFNFGIIFAYLFCFTATLQGFILFLYFIVFNKRTRQLYAQSVKSLFSKKEF